MRKIDMCGIIGYTGSENVKEVLLDALELLEYRGYDSAGIAVMEAHEIQVYKRAGRVRDLREKCKDQAEKAIWCMALVWSYLSYVW